MGLVIGIIVLVVVVILILVVIGIYNGLVRSRNATRNAYSQIDVQLKRRHDLIPNLVETAKGYIAHERGTLEAVTAARTAAVSAQSAVAGGGSVAAVAGAENQLTQALGRLFAVAEAYPDLKANQNMLALQEELTSTENRVAFARQAYNDSVLAYNNKREVFPSSVIAGMFNFRPAELFEVTDPGDRDVPKVQF